MRSPRTRSTIDEAELKSRREFFEIGDEDLARLKGLSPFAERYTHDVVDDLYRLILGHGESRRFFPDDSTLAHVKKAQRDYFLGLFSGRCDLAYVDERRRIGTAHERVAVPPKLYLGAYARYLRTIFARMAKDLGDPARLAESYESLMKLVAFDMAIAMDTYIEAHLDTIARHQSAIRELSTPVIRIYDRILLLPLIGTVDTRRAEQLMEAVLLRVVEEHARVIIIDIAGVPVVDTKVAEHLLRTTDAVRLLGGETILSGISPTVAKTIVRLGVDVSSMHTRSRLSDALGLAFKRVGVVTRKRAEPALDDDDEAEGEGEGEGEGVGGGARAER